MAGGTEPPLTPAACAGWMVEGGSRGGAIEQPPGVAGGDMSPCCCWPSAVEITFAVVHNLGGAQTYRQAVLNMAVGGSLRVVVQCICEHASMMQQNPQPR